MAGTSVEELSALLTCLEEGNLLRLLDEDTLVEHLLTFRGGGGDEARAVLSKQLPKCAETVAGILQQVDFIVDQMEKAQRNHLAKIASLENQASVQRAAAQAERRPVERRPGGPREKLRRAISSSSRVQELQAEQKHVQQRLQEVERELRGCQARRTRGRQLEKALDRAKRHLKGCFVVTVGLSGNLLYCIGIDGKEVLPPQAAKVTFAALTQALEEVAPAGVAVELVSRESMLVRAADDTPMESLLVEDDGPIG
eukprot:TRINITY_DN106650_c0_g1_i1.p1 TRINITY_DN106650_c0_g1~~TRINITY_DN106650_c0_g1_i1.p1  ORF type:complete len:255 (+),score=69.07 TRINITY_DN106650_c0_g1_i1:52-816(+)